MKLIQNLQSGRSMVEMLGVLAIIGVLSVAGIAGYSKAMAKFKQSKLLDQISTLSTNIRTAFANQADYTDLSKEAIINMGLIDDTMKVLNNDGTVSLTEIRNVYGGSVEVALISGRMSFILRFTGIPKDACVIFGTTDWGYKDNNRRVSINGRINEGGISMAEFVAEHCTESSNTIGLTAS